MNLLNAYSCHFSLSSGSTKIIKKWSLYVNIHIPAGMTDTHANHEAMWLKYYHSRHSNGCWMNENENNSIHKTSREEVIDPVRIKRLHRRGNIWVTILQEATWRSKGSGKVIGGRRKAWAITKKGEVVWGVQRTLGWMNVAKKGNS